MNTELLIVTFLVGLGTYAMRVLPTKLNIASIDPHGPFSRFLNATGPAAITALCVSAFMPLLEPDWSALIALAAGVAGTLGGYLLRRDISLATIIGATAYGVAIWLL